jgi:hypothetical protein
VASYITMRAKTAATAKRALSKPSSRPTLTAKALTVAEWLEGIPPVSRKRSHWKRPSRR